MLGWSAATDKVLLTSMAWMANIHVVLLIESSTSPMDHCDRQCIPSLVTVEKPILDISGRRAITSLRALQRHSSFLPHHTRPQPRRAWQSISSPANAVGARYHCRGNHTTADLAKGSFI
ncbi:hypothetical protein F5144DRAFT_584179, partial [Chaetomium tenue]